MPADWKYQSGVCSSWSTVSCSLNVNMLLPLPDNRASRESMDARLKVGPNRHARADTGECISTVGAPVELFSCHASFQEELKAWAQQIQSGAFLIDGKKLPEDSELTFGQVVWSL